MERNFIVQYCTHPKTFDFYRESLEKGSMVGEKMVEERKVVNKMKTASVLMDTLYMTVTTFFFKVKSKHTKKKGSSGITK